MVVDLSGCGAQALGPVNATLASSLSAVFYAVMACADEPIAANAGCYRPVRVVAPEGLVVNARHPAPVATASRRRTGWRQPCWARCTGRCRTAFPPRITA